MTEAEIYFKNLHKYYSSRKNLKSRLRAIVNSYEFSLIEICLIKNK